MMEQTSGDASRSRSYLVQSTMVLKKEVSESSDELNDTSSIDSPELIAALKRLPTKVTLLEYQMERMRTEHKKELEKMSSTFKTDLALKNDKIALLEQKIKRSQKEHKMELDKMASSFERVLAIKNDKIGELDHLLAQIATLKEVANGGNEDCQSESPEEEEEEKEKVTGPSSLAMFFKGYLANQPKFTVMEETKSDVSGPKQGVNLTLLRAMFADVSKLTKQHIFSTTTRIDEVEWTFIVSKKDDHLSLSLVGDLLDTSNFPHFPALDISLISQKMSRFDRTMRVERVPTVHDDYYHYFDCDKFMPIKDLFDEEKDYVKDDSIIVQAVILPSSQTLRDEL